MERKRREEIPKEIKKVEIGETKYTLETLITEDEIGERVNSLAEEIANDYKDKKVILVGVLNGATTFLNDLTRALWNKNLMNVEVDYMGVESYDGTESSRTPKITKDLKRDINQEDVLIIEDILDTGFSMDTLLNILGARNPNSLEVCSLLSKPSRREIPISAKYVGFEIPDEFVVGYGLDLDEKFRGSPKICIIRDQQPVAI